MESKCLKFFGQQKKPLLFVSIFVFLVNFLLLAENYSSYSSIVLPKNSNQHVYYFGQRHFVNKSEKQILLWTRYFYDVDWESNVRRALSASCPHRCSVTTDKTAITGADAVLFHLLDLYFWETPPKYRAPHQVWVLHNAEPPPHQYYTGRTLAYSPFVFNWTFSYRQDSTIVAPYGHAFRKSKKALQQKSPLKDFAKEKSKMTYGVISNCVDDAGRFSYVKSLRKYTPIDLYGRCGNLSCPRDGSCDAILKPYRFGIAFENSNCKSYTSEKFWKALQRESIPLVNWVPEQIPPDAPPKSYINVREFEMEALAKHLKNIAENDTEYNSYFEWKKMYDARDGFFFDFCKLCKALHNESIPAQMVNFESWLSDDVCDHWTVRIT